MATALVGSEDPGLLTESLRLMQTCFLVLREERDRSKLLKPFADAWASLAISLKTRVLFCIENSLDARLVARALELAFAARFFPDPRCSAEVTAFRWRRWPPPTPSTRQNNTHRTGLRVFHALCVEDALLKAPYKTSAPRTCTRRSSTSTATASTRRCAFDAASFSLLGARRDGVEVV